MTKEQYEYDSSFAGQINVATPLTIQTAKKVPAIADRIFSSYDAMVAYIGAENTTAIPGLMLSVWNDDTSVGGDASTNTNAIYQVMVGESGVLFPKKQMNVDSLEKMVETLEIYSNIHFDRGLVEHRGVNTSEYGNYFNQSDYFGVTADASSIRTNDSIEVIGVTVGNLEHMDIIPADTSVEEILRMILTREIGVEAIDPSVSITGSGFTSGSTYEVGTNINYTLTYNYSDGYFQSADKTYYTDASFNAINDTSNGKLMSQNAIQSVDYVPASSGSISVEPGSYTFSAAVNYGATPASVVPKTNLGNYDSSNGVIPAGTCNSNTLTMYGRYKYFFGWSEHVSFDEFTSAEVRALTAASGWANVSGETVLVSASSTITSNGTSIVMACPPGYSFSKILDPMTKGSYLPNFTSDGYVTVGIGGGNTASYHVYVYPVTSGAKVSFCDIRIKKD